MQSGQAILSQDKFDEIQSVADMNIRSIMCVPLVGAAGRALGVLQIDTRDHRTRFQQEDLEVLASVANLAAVAVENTRLHETEIAKLALDHDLHIAHNVQKRFLPCQLPRYDGYEFYHFYEAARQIGGDFFDYIALPDHRLAVVVADVSGKGIPAALMMAKMSAETRYVLVSERDPAAALIRLNAEFCEAGWEDRFVTMAVVVIDLDRHEAQIVNAGHMPPFLRNGAGSVLLLGEQEAGLPLGVSSEFGYRSIAVPLAPGDCLTMFTDGINEAMDPHGTQYGMERLAGQLRRGNLSVRQLGERILDNVKEFAGASAQFDDMCLLCFGRE
jgi:sigma-B regulation protein RsbU (phosphoserine phosphatase)